MSVWLRTVTGLSDPDVSDQLALFLRQGNTNINPQCFKGPFMRCKNQPKPFLFLDVFRMITLDFSTYNKTLRAQHGHLGYLLNTLACI